MTKPTAEQVQRAEEFAGVLLRTEIPKYAVVVRARDKAIVEAACAAIREACSQCENGNVVTDSVEYGHACGGDDRKCATACPVEVQVQDVTECEYCGRPIAAIREALRPLLDGK